MVTGEGTSYGLTQDSKVHGHVKGVGEDNGVCTNEDLELKMKSGI